MIIYIYGADTFRSRQYLKEQAERFKKTRDPQGYNTVFLSAKKEGNGHILSELSAAPFLAEKRMVIIENVLSSSDKDFLSELISKIKDNKMPESIVAVFWQGDALSKVKEAKELNELLKKEKYAQEFFELAGSSLVGWIEAEIKKRNGKIGRQAADLLGRSCAGDMWFLNSLLDQLIAYAQTKEIDSAMVREFVDEKVDDNVFNMVEAIVSGNKKQAYKLLMEQRRLGEDDFKLFGLIVWQFRTMMVIRSLFDSEDSLNSEAMAKKLGLHPFVVKKNLSLVKKYNKKQLTNIYDQLLGMDFKAKTGQAELGLSLDLFISSIC